MHSGVCFWNVKTQEALANVVRWFAAPCTCKYSVH